MKTVKFLKSVLIGSALLFGLTGCGNYTHFNNSKDLLTPQELSMVQVFDDGYLIDGYDRLYISIQGLRNKPNPKNAEAPFCDVVGIIESIESKFTQAPKENKSILTQWKAYKGEDLRTSCNRMNEPEAVEKTFSNPVEQPDVEFSDIKQQVIGDTVTLQGETLLSPEKVRELTISAKQCNRAKNKLLEITEDRKYLNIQDYEIVTKLILDCEMLNLEKELNSN